MESLIEIGIIIFLIVVQSIFGVGLLLFGTPTFLILGYDFANTINILMPVSISISILQFFKSKISDKKFIREYNIFCLPFLIIFLVIALKFKYIIDFKLLVGFLLGSLFKIWPFYKVLEYNASNEPIYTNPVIPTSSQQGDLMYFILFSIIGFVSMWLIEKKYIGLNKEI